MNVWDGLLLFWAIGAAGAFWAVARDYTRMERERNAWAERYGTMLAWQLERLEEAQARLQAKGEAER